LEETNRKAELLKCIDAGAAGLDWKIIGEKLGITM